MLEMRAQCETCAAPLPPDAPDAYICTHECTFCAACTHRRKYVCPNCGGELVRRPRAAAAAPR
jgi:uncharacterized protein